MKNVALNYIRDEHRRIAQVMVALESVLADIETRRVEPDFALLASILYYIDAFPETQHHPKEETLLFAAMRSRPGCDRDLLDDLTAEHQRSAQMMRDLERSLVHWMGGKPDGPGRFARDAHAFVAFQLMHMRKEESHVLPAAESILVDADWTVIADEFARNSDPLQEAAGEHEFRKLYGLIKMRSPSKLKKML